MKMRKRIIAMAVAMCVISTSAAPSVWAQEIGPGIQEGKEQTQELAEQAEEKLSAEQPGEQAEEKLSAEQPGEQAQAGQPQELEGQPGEQAQAEPGILQFVMQESEFLQIPGIQNVVAGLGKDGTVLEDAFLHYVNTSTGQEFTARAQAVSGNMARFCMEYQQEEQSGVYVLDALDYQAEGKTYHVTLAEQDMEVSYGVNCQAEAEPDEVLVNQALLDEVEANVVTLDENGSVASDQSVEDVLGGLQAGGGAMFRSVPKAAKDMVVILDPGHDNTHAGAGYHGLREQDLTLKIALYCREELQKYGGVSIFMTRETGACPFGGWNATSADCNARRVEFAQSKKADVYVSFHLNASPSASAKGVGVYYPNSNYRKDISEEGKALATEIYQKLAALGLSTWADGIVIRNSENNTTYPDGSLADYLAIIRRSKLAGFPAVLIEHAFLSNASDVADFLNSDEKLQRLGIADAEAIAGYYNLSLRGNSPTISGIQSRSSAKLRIQWQKVDGAVSYQLYRRASEETSYTRIAEVTKDSYDDNGLSPQNTYYYKVRAVLEDGERTKFSKPRAASPLAQPMLSSVISKDGQLRLTWNEIEGASKYEVYRSEAADGEYKKIASQKAQAGVSYTDAAVSFDRHYYYKIRARGGENNGFGSYSEPMYGWAIQPSAIVRVSSKTSTSLLVKWKKVPNAYAYRLQRSIYKNKGYKTVATLRPADVTKYVDQKLKKGVKYYYRVVAVNRVNGKVGTSKVSGTVAENTISPTSIRYVRSKNSKSMEIGWGKAPGAYAYRIKRSTKENGSYQKVADVKGSSNITYVDKSIVPGKKYYYVVETIVKKNGVNHYSGNSKPAAARNLGAVKVKSLHSQESGIQIAWEAVAGANGYQIVRSGSKSGPYKSIAKLKGKSSLIYTDHNVEVGKPYYYKIRALHTGKVTGYGSYTGVQEKWMLDSPKGVKVSAQKPDRVKLSWKKKAGAGGYEILRSAKEGSGYQVVGSVSAGKTAFTDKSVLPNKTYYYKVTATGSWGLSEIGEEPVPVKASTAVEDSKVVSITAKSDGGIVLDVKEVSGAYGYEIERSQEAGSGFQVIGEASQGTTFIDHDVVEGTTYYYKVRTIWMAGEKKYYSGYSDVCQCSFSFTKHS